MHSLIISAGILPPLFLNLFAKCRSHFLTPQLTFNTPFLCIRDERSTFVNFSTCVDLLKELVSISPYDQKSKSYFFLLCSPVSWRASDFDSVLYFGLSVEEGQFCILYHQWNKEPSPLLVARDWMLVRRGVSSSLPDSSAASNQCLYCIFAKNHKLHLNSQRRQGDVTAPLTFLWCLRLVSTLVICCLCVLWIYVSVLYDNWYDITSYLW